MGERDMRQRLGALADACIEGSEIRTLLLEASERIRILENEVSDLRSFGEMARDHAKAVLGRNYK